MDDYLQLRGTMERRVVSLESRNRGIPSFEVAACRHALSAMSVVQARRGSREREAAMLDYGKYLTLWRWAIEYYIPDASMVAAQTATLHTGPFLETILLPTTTATAHLEEEMDGVVRDFALVFPHIYHTQRATLHRKLRDYVYLLLRLVDGGLDYSIAFACLIAASNLGMLLDGLLVVEARSHK